MKCDGRSVQIVYMQGGRVVCVCVCVCVCACVCVHVCVQRAPSKCCLVNFVSVSLERFTWLPGHRHRLQE